MLKGRSCSNNIAGLKPIQNQCEHRVGCLETTHCFLQTKDNDALMSVTLYCPPWNTAAGRKPAERNGSPQHLQCCAMTPILFSLSACTSVVKYLRCLTPKFRPPRISEVPSQREKGNEQRRKNNRTLADREYLRET